MTTNCLIGTARGSLIPELDGFWLKSARDKDKRLCIYWDLKEQMSLTLESDEPLKHSYKSKSWLCRTFLTSDLPSCWEALEMVEHNRLCKTYQHSMGSTAHNHSMSLTAHPWARACRGIPHTALGQTPLPPKPGKGTDRTHALKCWVFTWRTPTSRTSALLQLTTGKCTHRAML